MIKKAQASVEYIVISALILLIILPTIHIFSSYSQTSNEEVKQSQINKVGTDIVDVAEQLYYLGEPSKATLDAILPDGIERMEIWHNQELVFFLNDGTQIPFKSRVNITTDQECTEHTERCRYNFKKTIYSPGLKHILLKAVGDRIIIGEADGESEGGSGGEEPGCTDIDHDGYGDPGSSLCPLGAETDCDDDNGSICPNPISCPDLCNGVDDDCNAGTADGSGETAPDNSKQEGVCLGSTKSCTAGSWQDDYSGVANYEDPETSCDGLDNDCDGSTDEGLTTTYYQDFDSDTYGNLSVTQDVCIQPIGYVLDNTDCDDNNANINPGETEVCDGIDNDCNAGTADGSGEAAPPNSDQDGVCSGSTQSCTAGSWQDDYTGIANYEATEATCNDGLDNDCDTESDYDSQDGRHGDDNCKVAVTAIVVSDLNPIENSQIDVTCTVSPVVVDGFNSIFAYIDENSNGVYDAVDSNCGWNPGSGWNADFSKVTFKDCDVGSAGSKQAACGVYSSPTEPFDRSYQEGSDQIITINVISSICSARTQSDCAIGSLCEWCYQCESSISGKEDSTKYSGDVNRCVDIGNCVYNCENNECGASCDSAGGCIATECDYLDRCYIGTYRNYLDVPNRCQPDCKCTNNLCIRYTPIITDNDNDGYDIECDNDCNDNNPDINPGATEICNGVDDDCNAGTADGSGEAAPPNSDQDGVCLGSTQSCTAGSWQNDYSGVANYESPETSCSDGLDNNCDGNTDCDDSDCDGDPACVTCIDNDGDGYGVCPNCNISQGCDYDGDDCCDSDANVYPGQTEYFPSISNCLTWDYDCSGGISESGCTYDTVVRSGQSCNCYWTSTCLAGTATGYQNCEETIHTLNCGESAGHYACTVGCYVMCSTGGFSECDRPPCPGSPCDYNRYYYKKYYGLRTCSCR